MEEFKTQERDFILEYMVKWAKEVERLITEMKETGDPSFENAILSLEQGRQSLTRNMEARLNVVQKIETIKPSEYIEQKKVA